MLLQNIKHYNDLSPKLREALEKKITGYGKMVRYRFDISNPNPDPTNYNGKTLYPFVYTLDPAVFDINDPHETREGHYKSKRIGLIDRMTMEGMPDKFRKIKVHERDKGVLRLDLEVSEQRELCMYIEMHPKLKDGMFADKTKRQLMSVIDEQGAANAARAARTARSKAMRIAEEMSDKAVIDFADAMVWDSSQDIAILRNEVESLAESNPEFFNELVEGEKVEYQATVRQALNKGVIAFDPAEFKFTWTGNSHPIVMLQNVSGKNHVEQLAEWLQSGGAERKEIYKKIKGLLK